MHQDLNEIAQALAFTQPKSKPNSDGTFAALVELDITLANEVQRSALLEYLTGHLSDNQKLFVSPVADVNQQPVAYPSEEAAMASAVQRAQNIQREFMYGLYAQLGIALDVSSPQTLYFKKRV